jgi:hypothetical protein
MKYLIIFTLFLLYSNSFCQSLDSTINPWEWEDLTDLKNNETLFYVSNGNVLANKLISFYRQKIAVNSISRCPFQISCSQYALLAVKRYGVIKGVALFVDRNFYRENIAIFYYYPLVEDNNCLLKLDDAYFLFLKDDGVKQ